MNIFYKTDKTFNFKLIKAYEDDVGYDLKAAIDEKIILEKGERKLINTGIYLELPSNVEGQIRPRSGNALKKGYTVLNSPGTIDPGYRGQIQVIIINHGDKVVIKPKEAITQIIFNELPNFKLMKIEGYGGTSLRAIRGFGSSG